VGERVVNGSLVYTPAGKGGESEVCMLVYANIKGKREGGGGGYFNFASGHET